MIIPQHIQLFGPIPGQGAIITPGVDVLYPDWNFLTALTANTKEFRFDLHLSRITYARWVTVWIPTCSNQSIRLVHMDDGPSNIITIAQIDAPVSVNPRVDGAVITEQLNDLVRDRQAKHIGFQTKADSNEPWRIYESRLEIYW